jgi:membrane-anchored glycerophosphoryl diester phosphodiesterase (GDPDase)
MNKSLKTCPHKWCSKNHFAFPHPNHKKLIYTLQGSTCTVAVSALIGIPFLMHPKTGVPDLSTSNQKQYLQKHFSVLMPLHVLIIFYGLK